MTLSSLNQLVSTRGEILVNFLLCPVAVAEELEAVDVVDAVEVEEVADLVTNLMVAEAEEVEDVEAVVVAMEDLIVQLTRMCYEGILT